jgi:hypothetical protein
VARFVADAEKKGIPTAGLCFPDQQTFFQNVVLTNGVPNSRFVATPRTGTGPERVAVFIDAALKALTDPLTAKEKESGLYSPPPNPRIIFTGTFDDSQTFFQATSPVSNCKNCPIAKWTDGLPIIVPTEQKVKEMLTGTSHKSDEQVKSQLASSITRPKGTLVTYGGGAYYATVENVATIAVMAGCRPEYLPVVLAVATAGGGSTNCPGTSSTIGFYFVVSGPIAKEIGMNSQQEALDIGNPANMTIGRTAAMMTINFGQCIVGISRTDSGNPANGHAFAEDLDSLPGSWIGYNEESTYVGSDNKTVNYKKTESVLGKGSMTMMDVQQYAPSSFRGLIASGTGGMAKRMGVEGVPGPHNFLEYVMPLLISSMTGARTLIMHPNMAKSLNDYGFKSKADVYKWMYDTYTITAEDYTKYGWWDFSTSGGQSIEPTSGKKYIDLAPNYPIHVFSSQASNCILVSIGNADEICWEMSGRPTSYPIDPWK